MKVNSLYKGSMAKKKRRVTPFHTVEEVETVQTHTALVGDISSLEVKVPDDIEDEVPEPVYGVEDNTVALYFTKRTGVRINGISYDGDPVDGRYEVIAPDFETAGEIVRLAREAYGDEVLAI